jgi:hypothetical protein
MQTVHYNVRRVLLHLSNTCIGAFRGGSNRRSERCTDDDDVAGGISEVVRLLTMQVRELLVPVVTDGDANIEVAGCAALALGLVFVGGSDEDAVGACLQVLPRFSHPPMDTSTGLV